LKWHQKGYLKNVPMKFLTVGKRYKQLCTKNFKMKIKVNGISSQRLAEDAKAFQAVDV
jgi:hypothetical protein